VILREIGQLNKTEGSSCRYCVWSSSERVIAV